MNEYVDVRGPVPVYFNGMIAVELVGFNRDVTLMQARNFAFHMEPRGNN